MVFLVSPWKGFVAGLCIGATFVFLGINVGNYLTHPQDFKDVAYWQDRIKVVGPDEAYAEHVRIVAAQNIQQSHTLAHVFGSAIYKEIGIDAVAVCQNDYAFGCLHEVFERVVSEQGPVGLKQAVEACSRDQTRLYPCHHALGHGLVAYFGYHENAVNNALALCDADFNADPINGCVGGVFMEFNLYTSISPTIEARDVDEHGWYYPCTAIPEKYHRACYFWLPQWWREVMRDKKMEGDEIFSVMGEQCEAAPNQTYVRECFQRIGQHATYQSGYESGRAKQLCDIATDDPLYNFLCKTYSAFSFRYTDERFAEQALSMCSEFDGEKREYCEEFAENKTNISWAPDLPREFLEHSSKLD